MSGETLQIHTSGHWSGRSGDESCSNDDLPDTQNVTSETGDVRPVESQSTAAVWGRLFSQQDGFQSIDFEKEAYTLGRSLTCDVVYSERDLKNNVLLTLSKYHFNIERHLSSAAVVKLTDLSSNGTFVNGNLVGRNNCILLNNNDEISLASAQCKVYIFIDCGLGAPTLVPEEVTKQYVVSRVLGTGAFGEVRLVFDKTTTKRYAMKTMTKKKTQGIYSDCREARVLIALDHPCIIQIIHVIDTPDTHHLILELMEGGDLLARLNEVHQFHEAEARFIFYQVALAVNYLHSKKISHRDLKMENILMQAVQEYPLVKIADFGMSKELDDSFMTTFCGTPYYVAPEILRNKGRRSYTEEVDIWSCGVILYICLSGKMPFNKDDKLMTLEQQIMRGYYFFPVNIWRTISTPAIAFIKSMLVTNPLKRFSISQVINDPWILQDLNMRKKLEIQLGFKVPKRVLSDANNLTTPKRPKT